MDTPEKKSGKLFIVSTPIGNKDDISLRALGVIKICDFVLCEELKEGARFLKSINLQKEIHTLNEQNETEQSLVMLEKLESGSKIALISDCGTPLFADPGKHLVNAAIKAEIDIEVVPGASSIMTALVRSGLDISSFVFAGFVSRKSDERFFELKELSKESRTVVILETPYRFNTFLENAAKVMPQRRAYIGMNLTMAYETHHYGTFKELFEKFENENIKAEFVVCFEGNPTENTFSKAADTLYSNDNYERKPQYERPSGNREGANIPRPYKSRDDKPGYKPRFSSSSSDRGGFKPKFGDKNRSSGSAPGFKPRFDRDNDRGGERSFKPRYDKDRDNGGDREFKPRFDREGSGDREFKPRFDREGSGDREFKPRFDREGSGDREFKPRFDREGSGDRGFKPSFNRDSDSSGDRGFKPRSDRDSSGDRGFKPRTDRDSDRSSGKPYKQNSDRKFSKPFGDRDFKKSDSSKKSFSRDKSKSSGFKSRKRY